MSVRHAYTFRLGKDSPALTEKASNRAAARFDASLLAVYVDKMYSGELMRIWFVPVSELDDRHLLGEHLELHVMANALIRGGGGWYDHPATKMFRGKLGALRKRHEEQVAEMARRGFTGHKTPFPVDMIHPDEMDAEIEITEEMLKKDREDLAERVRLTEEHGGMSWRKAKKLTDERAAS